MTVRELITAMQKMPPDAPVYCHVQPWQRVAGDSEHVSIDAIRAETLWDGSGRTRVDLYEFMPAFG